MKSKHRAFLVFTIALLAQAGISSGAEPEVYVIWQRVQSLDPKCGAQIQTLRIGRGGQLCVTPLGQKHGVLIGTPEFVEPFSLNPTRLARSQALIQFELPQSLSDLIQESAVAKPGSASLRGGGLKHPVVR